MTFFGSMKFPAKEVNWTGNVDTGKVIKKIPLNAVALKESSHIFIEAFHVNVYFELSKYSVAPE